MANILRNVDKIITSAPASKEIDLNNIQAAGGGNQVMTIATTNDAGGSYHFNQTITFSVTGTSALAGQSITKLEYAWDGGSKTVIANSNSGTFTHMETTAVTYASNPSYTEMHLLSLTATDSLGNTFTKDFSLNYTLAAHLQATGGTITEITDANGQDWRVHTFTGSSQFVVTYAPPSSELEYLVVAGGGGGYSYFGGAGGGGYRSSVQGESSGGASGLNNPETPLSLSAGTYQVTVGGGGTGALHSSTSNRGEDSSFDTIVAIGGGSPYDSYASHSTSVRNGGSGAGGEYTSGHGPGSGTVGQGHSGGTGANDGITWYSGGGGGGAGGAGQSVGGNQYGGNGGAGRSSSINGTATNYAAGGGGGCWGRYSTGYTGVGGDDSAMPSTNIGYDSPVPNAPANRGGGGAGNSSNANATIGSGGSGIVIVRYKI